MKPTQETTQPLTRKYILTHTPRQIAAEYSLDEIEDWEDAVSSAFDGSDGGDIFGPMSPTEHADAVASLEDCQELIDDWYEDTPEDERPDAEDLQFAYQIMAAAYIKRAEEWENG